MKVFLFRISDSTGLEILKRVVRDRHTVKILAQNPVKLNFAVIKQPQASQVDQVKFTKGDIFEPDKPQKHSNGCDFIISALDTGTDNSYTEIYSRGR